MVLKEFQKLEDNDIYYCFTTGIKMDWQRCCQFINKIHKFLKIEEILSVNNSDKEYKPIVLNNSNDIFNIEAVDIIRIRGKNQKYNNLEIELILYKDSNVINVLVSNLQEKTGMDENKYASILEEWMNKIDNMFY